MTWKQRRDDRKGDDGASSRGPVPLAEVLGDLFAARGLARVRGTAELAEAWAHAVGEAGQGRTRVDGVRRGVLTITVAHPTLLAELATFRKAELLAALRRKLAEVTIHDIRFRIGSISNDDESPPSARTGRERT